MCTKGPSLPILRPPPIARLTPVNLAARVLGLMKLRSLTPERIAFISGIPEPCESWFSQDVAKVASSARKIQ